MLERSPKTKTKENSSGASLRRVFFHHSIFDTFHFDRKTIGKICPMYNMLNYPNFDSIDVIEIGFKVRIRD